MARMPRQSGKPRMRENGFEEPCPGALGRLVRNANPSEYGQAIKSMLDGNRTNGMIDAFFSKHIADWTEGPEHWPALPAAPRTQGSSRAVSVAVSVASSAVPSLDPYSIDPISKVPRTFRLLYIPDPSRAHRSREGFSDDLAWVKRNLRKDQLRKVRDMRGFFFRERPTREDLAEEGWTYRLSEWLWAILCLSDYRVNDDVNGFEVDYMQWCEFKEVLIDPRASKNRPRWEFIRSHDVIIGGFDYTIDTCSPLSIYNLHGEDRKRYDATLGVLMRVVKFWPPVPSLLAAAHKWTTVAILDMVAAGERLETTPDDHSLTRMYDTRRDRAEA
ncbi:hypothetical protein J3R83DRAFT_5777 [Lanmaoa asiatica]|nr:hypothetical protein J3R83DRAFT_5777 [Lanmaoa asiatica]